MSKRDIPVNADEETRFALIMEGLLEQKPLSGFKPPKIVRCTGDSANWEYVGKKPESVTDGYDVAEPSLAGSAP